MPAVAPSRKATGITILTSQRIQPCCAHSSRYGARPAATISQYSSAKDSRLKPII